MPQISPINWIIILSFLVVINIIYYTNIPVNTNLQDSDNKLVNTQNNINW